MFKLWAAILKETRLLTRDRVGLTSMFLMPVFLVFIITSVQKSAFELANKNKINMVISNSDTGKTALDYISLIGETGMFNLLLVDTKAESMDAAIARHNALLALQIPASFSASLHQKAKQLTDNALVDFGLKTDSVQSEKLQSDSVLILFNPILQQSYRQSILGALQSASSLLQNKLMLSTMYAQMNSPMRNNKKESSMEESGIAFKEQFFGSTKKGPNVSQHNVPAWTVFAMFFMVISLGSNIIKEKLSGSFVRLKMLPTNYYTGLFAKQLVYLCAAMVQVAVIFSMGVFVFPLVDLPALNMPANFFALLLVCFVCAGCAISYAQCIGVFANTQEQANGFGAASVVILAAIGGVFVPTFAMPHSFTLIMKASPFYWSLQSFYGLFLEGKKFTDILANILPLAAAIGVLQVAAYIGLKRKNLI